jgi:hypothetical protein
MKGYVAVQKKLLTTMFALWLRNEAFDALSTGTAENIQIQQQVRANDNEAVFSSRHTSTIEVTKTKLALNEQG